MIGPRVMVAFATSLSTRCTAAGIRPARAGNFLLSRQKKVTKEEALNRTLPEACDGPRAKAGARTPALGEPLRSRRCPYPQRNSSIGTPPNAGCTPGSRAQIQASLGRRVVAHGVSIGEPGVQPALSGTRVRSLVLVTGTAARAQRLASGHRPNARSRARAVAAAHWRAVQRLSFGDFSLARQRKVTRPPGRTPGAVHRVERLSAKASMTSPRPA